MPNLVVVAIPSADDRVWKVSSEKVPHMTILYLGEMPVRNFAEIAGFVEHAAKQSLHRFGMEVDRRGTLGDEGADVLFFEKTKWGGYPSVAEFRSFLLQDDNIRAAYQAVEQFPEWLPHLTLGYPETPAKKSDDDRLYYVDFDRIALWFNDYEGFEYPLKRYEWEDLAEVAMGDTARGRTATEQILQHYGVKGMKWGVRRKRTSRVTVTQKRGGARLKAKGGEGRPAHKDAVRIKAIQQVMKKSGIQAVSNEDLRAYNDRLNMEMSARRLTQQNTGAGKKFIADQIDIYLKSNK